MVRFTKNYLATSNLILSGTFNDHFMCVCLHPFFVLKHLHTPQFAHTHIHIHALQPILCIHWIKENNGDDKTFHFPSLFGHRSVICCYRGRGDSWKNGFHFPLGLEESFCQVLLRAGLETRAFSLSLSLSLWLTDGLGMDLCELGFFWGLWLFSILCIFLHTWPPV